MEKAEDDGLTFFFFLFFLSPLFFFFFPFSFLASINLVLHFGEGSFLLLPVSVCSVIQFLLFF